MRNLGGGKGGQHRTVREMCWEATMIDTSCPSSCLKSAPIPTIRNDDSPNPTDMKSSSCFLAMEFRSTRNLRAHSSTADTVKRGLWSTWGCAWDARGMGLRVGLACEWNSNANRAQGWGQGAGLNQKVQKTARRTTEGIESGSSPARHTRVGSNRKQILRRTRVAFEGWHVQCFVERSGELRLGERVDAQRAVEKTREARKFGDDKNSRRQLPPPR